MKKILLSFMALCVCNISYAQLGVKDNSDTSNVIAAVHDSFEIIVGAIVCGIIGFLTSKDGERGEGALQGCLGGAVGCGSVVFYVFLSVLGLVLLLGIAGWLFD